MKLVKKSEKEYLLKLGNRIVAKIYERCGKWNAVEGNLGVKCDRESFDKCLNDYLEYRSISIFELKSKMI